MSSWDKRYSDRVQLLVDILPVLAKETRFALKGVLPSTCLSMISPGYQWIST